MTLLTLVTKAKPPFPPTGCHAQACEWRHTCVVVLCAQLEAGGLPRAAGALPQLQEALAAGPYVAGSAVAAGVAVGSRGAGGG